MAVLKDDPVKPKDALRFPVIVAFPVKEPSHSAETPDSPEPSPWNVDAETKLEAETEFTATTPSVFTNVQLKLAIRLAHSGRTRPVCAGICCGRRSINLCEARYDINILGS